MYRVQFNHWKNGTGYTHSEDFDWLDEYCTAEEYVENMDENPLLPDDDAVKVSIFDEDGVELSYYTLP